MKKLIIFILPLLLLFGCERNTKVYTYDMLYMDTYIEVKLYDVNKNDSDKLFKDVDNIYGSYAKLADRYTKYDDFVNVYYLNKLGAWTQSLSSGMGSLILHKASGYFFVSKIY